jgi:hypothetical protein
LAIRLAAAVVAAHTLEIADLRQSPVFRFREQTLRRPVQKLRLLPKEHNAPFRQRLNVFD